MHKIGLCSSVLDYGTGKGLLVDRLREELPETIRVSGYDPAVKRWSAEPDGPHDILTCLDVLEHVEIQSIDAVLQEIRFLTGRFCYVVVDLQPAVKRLADGRNAHILLAPAEWWVSRFSQVFACMTSFTLPHESGAQQKLVVVACENPRIVPHMHTFLNKINAYDLSFKAGSLKSKKG